MKKIIIIITILMTTLANAQIKWSADLEHSSIDFVIPLLGIVEVPGYFEDFEIKVETKKVFDNPSFKVIIKTKSINTKVEERNEHLKTDDFFDVEKYPTIEFISKSFEKLDGKKIRIVGDITIKGITKEIVFLGRLNGILENKDGAKAGLKLQGKISRKTFKIGEDTDIGDEVKVTIYLQLIKEN